MQFLEFRINGQAYYQFYTDRCIDCLDREKSEIEFFPDSDKVMWVDRYAFATNRLQDCDVFTVPEQSNGMFFWSQHTFFTEDARAVIERSDVVGLRFEGLTGQATST